MSQKGLKLKEILSRNLKEYRKKRGISQEKLAEICGLHRTYIGLIERCERNITLSTLETLSAALNIPAHELIMAKRD